MLVHIKEISKKKNKTDFSQHSCTNVFTAVADLQVQEFASYVRQNWKRFLDDCFIIWNSDIPVEIFHTELNSLNDHIRFTI